MEGFSIMEFKLLASQTGDIFNQSFLINQQKVFWQKVLQQKLARHLSSENGTNGFHF